MLNDSHTAPTDGVHAVNCGKSVDWVLGRNAVVRRIAQHAERVAEVQCSCLIWGETGTGKELWASLIHASGTRRPTVHPGQLRCADSDARRKPIVRPRARCLHRRCGQLARCVPRRQRRRRVSRRNRRNAARFAAQAFARSSTARGDAGRGIAPGKDRRASHRGDEPQPREGSRRRPVPRRSLLPPQHGRATRARLAATPGRYSGAHRVLFRSVSPAVTVARCGAPIARPCSGFANITGRAISGNWRKSSSNRTCWIVCRLCPSRRRLAASSR